VALAQIPGSDESGFSLRVQDKDGMIYKRTYAFSGYHVRMVSREPVAADPRPVDEQKVSSAPAPAAPAAPSVWEKMTDRMKRLWKGSRE
jgi:hypothetical protein